MTRSERRYSMALDEAYEYLQELQSGTQPSLYKLCAAVRTVDKALESSTQMLPFGSTLSVEAWSMVRDELFDSLISSFAGYFVVYEDGHEMPLTVGQKWPAEGRLEFYPESGQRKEDSYHAWLERIYPDIITVLRWCFAEGKQCVRPADFAKVLTTDYEDESGSADSWNEIEQRCRQEAQTGKKRAHQKWWQLYWEADSCRNKAQRHELRRQMEQLQDIWGRPS